MAFSNMVHVPLLISSILTHAVENKPAQRIMTALADGGLREYLPALSEHRLCEG